MIYYGIGCGDVVIDCGFTKCFLKMEAEGTYRYIRNLCAVTSRCDVLMKEGEDPQNWKPDCIEYKLDLKKKYFHKYFNRKIYIIDVEKPVSKEDKLFIYEEISKEIYSEYNNAIYFYNNGIEKINLEDILKSSSLIPKKNTKKNMKEMADNLIEDCIKNFGNDFNIMIFTDGFSINQDNKFMDYILSNDQINLDNKLYQLLLDIQCNITEDFATKNINKLQEIKTYEALMSNYKNIRNSIIFTNNLFGINLKFDIFEEIKRIKNSIIETLDSDDKKDEFRRKMDTLLFCSGVRVENVGFNNAAFE